MSLPIVVLPDAELAIVQYLTAVPEVTALQASVSTELGATRPAVLITRVLGQQIAYGVDEPVLQVDVLGDTKRSTQVLMQTVRGALLAIANDTVLEATLVSALEEVGPTWLPDTVPTPPTPRYTARYRVIIH